MSEAEVVVPAAEQLARRFRREFGALFARLRSASCAPAESAAGRDLLRGLNGLLFERFLGAAGRTDVSEHETTGAAPLSEDAASAARALFAAYPFTPFEATGDDAPRMAALDPEILATVFEEQAADRGANGAYYTPQNLVAFLCREALKAYLVDRLGNDAENAVFRFVDHRDPSALPYPATALSSLQFVRVVDPACGGGAFLIGMLQELAALRSALGEANGGASAHNLIGDIIARNLFGVDRDSDALRITRRRLWLARAVAGESAVPGGGPSDLAANLACGDSLSGPPPGSPDAPSEGGPPGSLDWARAFPGVFTDNGSGGGFDIFLANPPYGARISPETRRALATFYENTTNDSAAFFLERAVQIGRGVVCLIVPKSLGFYPSWGSIRRVLRARARLVATLDAGLAFEAANYEQIVVCYRIGAGGASPPPPARVFVAEPVHRFAPRKTVRPDGAFPNDLAAVAGVIPFRGVDEDEARTLRCIRDNAVFFDRLYAEAFRGLYLPAAEQAALPDAGPFRFVARVPDVGRWRIARTRAIDVRHDPKYVARAARTLRPRIFLKVLRGGRVVAYPDVSGGLLTTEKLVNFVLHDSSPTNLLYVAAVLNSVWPSRFVQQVVFSRTTETARVLDGALARFLPLPARVTEKEKAELAALAGKCLAAGGRGCDAWEARMDARVGALFGVGGDGKGT